VTKPSASIRDVSLRVIRSGQTASGAYLASPTFPTYQYCWFRDGAFIAHAMCVSGDDESAQSFHTWATTVLLAESEKVERAIDRRRSGLGLRGEDVIHTRYTADGKTVDGEWPNFQLDGLGIWLWSLGEWSSHHGSLTSDTTHAIDLVAHYLMELWSVPSYDCWEESGDQVHTSTLAAVYGGLRAASRLLHQPELAGIADNIREFVLTRSVVNGRLRKHLATDAVDASLIWAATPFRMFEPSDPIMTRTVAAINRDLTGPGGLLRRYLGDTYYGGGEWPLLTAQLGWYWLQSSRPIDASRTLHQVERAADGSGQLPEQILDGVQDPHRVGEWVERWGPVAKPLLWSHAAYLVLLQSLGDIAD
jgi:GH15 family glucan-1,4-alpha-glucosidase